MVRAQGQRAYPMPMFFPLISFSALMIAAISARTELIKQKTAFLAMSGVALLGIVGVFTTLYLTYTPVGQWYIDGVQGRYLLPLLPFALLGIAILLPIKPVLNKRFESLLYPIATALPLLAGVLWYWLIMY